MSAGPLVAMLKLIIPASMAIFAGYAVAGYVGWDTGVDFSGPPGIVAPDEPLQRAPTRGPFQYGDFQLRPVADFALTARLILAERYWTDPGSALSPIDLLVGWREMSDNALLSRIEFGHSGRHFSWGTAERLPLSANAVNRRMSNIHAIPASHAVRDSLFGFRPGDLITLRGYLVEASRTDGWAWGTSTSRNDSSSGACEVMFIEHASRNGP